MNKILIITHSTLAEGFYNSTKFLSGMTKNIKFINAYLDNSDWTIKAKKYLSSQDKNDHIVVATDIFGGSVNQKMTLMINEYNFTLITGINLPLILSLALSSNPLTKENCEKLVQEAKDQIRVVKPPKNKKENDEDFLN